MLTTAWAVTKLTNEPAEKQQPKAKAPSATMATTTYTLANGATDLATSTNWTPNGAPNEEDILVLDDNSQTAVRTFSAPASTISWGRIKINNTNLANTVTHTLSSLKDKTLNLYGVSDGTESVALELNGTVGFKINTGDANTGFSFNIMNNQTWNVGTSYYGGSISGAKDNNHVFLTSGSTNNAPSSFNLNNYTLKKTGSGVFGVFGGGNLNGPGNIHVAGGEFAIQNTSTTARGKLVVNGNINFVVESGAFLYIQQNITSTTSAFNFTGTADINGGTIDIHLNQPGDFAFGNNISLNGETNYITVTKKTATSNYDFTGNFSGSGALNLTVSQKVAGTVKLSGTNSYKGGTVVNNGDIIITGNNASADGGWLITAAGSTTFFPSMATSRATSSDGGTQTAGNSSVYFDTGSSIVVASGKAISIGNATDTKSSMLEVKGTVINNGILNVNKSGTLKIDDATTVFTQTGDVNLNGGAVQIKAGAPLDVTGSGIVAFSGLTKFSISGVTLGQTYTLLKQTANFNQSVLAYVTVIENAEFIANRYTADISVVGNEVKCTIGQLPAGVNKYLINAGTTGLDVAANWTPGSIAPTSTDIAVLDQYHQTGSVAFTTNSDLAWGRFEINGSKQHNFAMGTGKKLALYGVQDDILGGKVAVKITGSAGFKLGLDKTNGLAELNIMDNQIWYSSTSVLKDNVAFYGAKADGTVDQKDIFADLNLNGKTVTKKGAGDLEISNNWNINNGTFHVQEGILYMQNSGGNGNLISENVNHIIAQGGTLHIRSNRNTAGDDQLNIQGGTTTLNGGKLHIYGNSGTINFKNNIYLTASSTLQRDGVNPVFISGTISGNAGCDLTVSGVVDMSGSINCLGNIINTGTINMLGGIFDLSAKTALGGTLGLNGGTIKLTYGTPMTFGTLNLTSGTIDIAGASGLADGTYDLLTATTLNVTGTLKSTMADEIVVTGGPAGKKVILSQDGNTLKFKVETITGIETATVAGFSVTPNPVAPSATLTVTTSLEGATISIVDLQGKTISAASNTTTIAAPAVKGIYIVRVTNGKASEEAKIVVK